MSRDPLAELKPCPSCGEKADWYFESDVDGSHHWVACDTCLMRGPQVTGAGEEPDWVDLKDKAADAWDALPRLHEDMLKDCD